MNSVLLFCGKVQNPVVLESVQIIIYPQREILNDCILRAPGEKLAWTGLTRAILPSMSDYFKHNKFSSWETIQNDKKQNAKKYLLQIKKKKSRMSEVKI